MESVRFRLSSGRRSELPPRRFIGVVEMLGSWPALTWGGPRYLHQPRYQFTDQYGLMADSEFRKESVCWTISEEMMEAASYTMANLYSVDWRVSTDQFIGLGVHDDLEELDVVVRSSREVTSEAVKELAEKGDRIIQEIVYEYCRLN